MRRTRILTVLVSSVVVLAACGGSDSKTISTKDGDVTVSKDGDGGVKVDTDKGSASFGAGTELPDSFPTDDVPVPEDLELQTAIASNADQQYSLSYKLGKQDADDVLSDYRSTLQDAGFTIEDDASASFGGGQYSSLQATGNGWTVSTSSMSAAGGVLVISVRKDDSAG